MVLHSFFPALYIIKNTPASAELPYAYFFPKLPSFHHVTFALTFCPATPTLHPSGFINEVSLPIFMAATFCFLLACLFFQEMIKNRGSPDVFGRCHRKNSNTFLLWTCRIPLTPIRRMRHQLCPPRSVWLQSGLRPSCGHLQSLAHSTPSCSCLGNTM